MKKTFVRNEELKPEEIQKISKRPIDNIAAYEFYLRALQEIWKFEEKSLDQSLKYLQKGLDIVGDNALLLSTMGHVYWQYVNVGVKQEEYMEKAAFFIKKALAINPNSPQAHAIMGFISFWGNYQMVSLDLDIIVDMPDLEKVCKSAAIKGFKVEKFEHSVNLTRAGSDLRI